MLLVNALGIDALVELHDIFGSDKKSVKTAYCSRLFFCHKSASYIDGIFEFFLHSCS